LLIAGAVLATFTYMLLGLVPLLALWVGVAIVGASMFSTPVLRARYSKEVVLFINALLANLARIAETFKFSNVSTYVRHNGDVYIYVADRALEGVPEEPPRTFMYLRRGELVAVVKSPISRELIEGFDDVCSAVEYLIVDWLDLADGVRCVEEEDRVVVEVKDVRVDTPHKLERSIGSIYGIIAASTTALLRTGRAVLESDVGSNGRRIVVRKI